MDLQQNIEIVRIDDYIRNSYDRVQALKNYSTDFNRLVKKIIDSADCLIV